MIKDIPGYEGRYAASDDGQIWSHARHRFLNPCEDKGYKKISLTNASGVKRKELVHRLVARAFIPNPDPDTFTDIDHIDGNRSNNNINNLRWCTRSQNIKYAGPHKRTRHKIYCIEKNKAYDGFLTASRELGINKTSIRDNCLGILKSAGGLHFQILD